MASIEKNRKMFCITEGTIRNLAREMDLPKERLNPELMEQIRDVVWFEFRDWDNWLKEVIGQIVGED